MNCVYEICHTSRWRKRSGSRWGWWPSASSKYFHGLSQGIHRTIKKPIPIRYFLPENFYEKFFARKILGICLFRAHDRIHDQQRPKPCRWWCPRCPCQFTVFSVLCPLIWDHGSLCGIGDPVCNRSADHQTHPIPSHSLGGALTVSSPSWQCTSNISDPLSPIWSPRSAGTGSAPQRFYVLLCLPNAKHLTGHVRIHSEGLYTWYPYN